MLAGIALAFLPVGANLPLSRELIFNVFLPPMIFGAALQLKWQRFREQMPLTIVLAFLGVSAGLSSETSSPSRLGRPGKGVSGYASRTRLTV